MTRVVELYQSRPENLMLTLIEIAGFLILFYINDGTVLLLASLTFFNPVCVGNAFLQNIGKLLSEYMV
jgi:hypothetical protein